jgi:FimV-like protein
MKAEKSNRHEQDLRRKLDDAQLNIKKENFKEALQDLNLILEQNPQEVDALYNTGLVYYKMNDNANALQYFDKTLAHPDKKYFEDARWNKALTYFKMNDKANARKIISEIITSNNSYKKRAERLLEEMGGN